MIERIGLIKGIGGAVLLGAAVAGGFLGLSQGGGSGSALSPSNPCRPGFEYTEIGGDVATRTCAKDPYVVVLAPDGSVVRAFDTSGKGDIPISEVPGWSE